MPDNPGTIPRERHITRVGLDQEQAGVGNVNVFLVITISDADLAPGARVVVSVLEVVTDSMTVRVAGEDGS